MLMDFNNNFNCRMGEEDLSHVQFNRKLWNLRPVVKDSREVMRVPAWPEAYAHVKENLQVSPISADEEDVAGSHVSRHCPSHRSGS